MKELNLGPVSNPDGTPTELTKQMLEGTGRDPELFGRCLTAESARRKQNPSCPYGHRWVGDKAFKTPYHP